MVSWVPVSVTESLRTGIKDGWCSEDGGSKDQRLSLSKSSLLQLKLKSLMLQKKLTECSSNIGKEGTAH